MNAMKFSDTKSEPDMKYGEQAHSCNSSHRSKKRSRPQGLLIAAFVAAVALCGFAAYGFGLFDRWLQEPFSDPVQTVQSAMEKEAGEEYTIFMRVDEIKVDERETERIIKRYLGSDLAKSRGWTDEYLKEHFVVVWVKYDAAYDHTKTFLDDGLMEQYFYLTEDEKTGKWEIAEIDSPRPSAADHKRLDAER